MQINQAELIKIYDRQAALYDTLRKSKKTIDHPWRQQLLAGAKGKILEVSVGAGVNFKFYPKHAEVTAVDLSSVMLAKATGAAAESGIRPTLINARVEDLQFPNDQFDTIVSTFSLCAYEDPVHVLNLFNKWCKNNGQVLLLEHGTSRFKLLHWLQNKMDAYQYRKIGCHANRDIAELLRQSNLQVEITERKLFGAIYLIQARPAS